MKEKNILEALSDIRDEYIEEARTTKLKKHTNSWRRMAAIAACAILVIAISGIFIIENFYPFGGSSGGFGHDEGTGFMSYAGPVFPLTLSEPDNAITASRSLQYDFSLPHADSIRVWGADVTDSYILANSSAEEKRIKAIYPFAGSFSELYKQMPVIYVDGHALLPTLYAGGYAIALDDNDKAAHLKLKMFKSSSWEDYKNLLKDGQYQKNALAPYPDLSQKVTVYTFSDFKAPEGYTAATQAICFTIDPDKTSILKYGFNGGEFGENGFRRYSYFVPNAREKGILSKKMLIVIGDDITEYSLQGYKTGDCSKGNELEGVSCTVERSERILSELISEIVDDYFTHSDYNDDPAIPRQMVAGVLSDFMQTVVLTGSEKLKYPSEMIEDYILEVLHRQRVFYLVFEAAIPASESIHIKAEMYKEPSYDYTCSDKGSKGIQGYEMVTRLGSNLHFDSITAEIASFEFIKIVRQNFGFDKASGISKVTLDPNVEHYYLEIRALEISQSGGQGN